MPIFSVILIQPTPREPRAAIASHVLLTYPAHLGILPHAYLLCHYFLIEATPRGPRVTIAPHTQRTWVFPLTAHKHLVSLVISSGGGLLPTHRSSTPGYFSQAQVLPV